MALAQMACCPPRKVFTAHRPAVSLSRCLLLLPSRDLLLLHDPHQSLVPNNGCTHPLHSHTRCRCLCSSTRSARAFERCLQMLLFIGIFASLTYFFSQYRFALRMSIGLYYLLATIYMVRAQPKQTTQPLHTPTDLALLLDSGTSFVLPLTSSCCGVRCVGSRFPPGRPSGRAA